MPSWQRSQLSLEIKISLETTREMRKEFTCQNEDNETDQGRIAHVEHRTSETAKAHASRPEDERVQKHIATGHAGARKGAPVPPVVLRAEQEVHQQNGGSGRCDNHQTVAEEEKTKHVVDFVGPQRGHDEVELNEDRAERKDASQQDGWDGAKATRHGRDLTGDLVGLGWTFKSLYIEN